ncbi:glycoside hydrolase superfamily [Aspergillus avenaceus]|uniref:Alpha-galactosidase n=1 Tax=Aspergillus avenaceus TaxID=36643 RepID=A0A5N6TT69_ASPAV|nr:glycoside hydrolase superfamily [Aspergillus avenaceus]
MSSILLSLSLVSSVLSYPSLRPRLDNGLAKTPHMGWNTYNHYSCSPNESIVRSNAQALVDLGLAELGYRYVTTDCGWTIADRLDDGSLTWNETLFPEGFPALGRYLHDLGLLFGVYQDSGIKLCGSPPDQVGSLFHEEQDARTFASWEVDSLKYDNCYSDAATDYPNVNYEPSTSPQPRFANMSRALAAQNRTILFQICEWGIDFPALWAPELGHSWRIGNDIIPEWQAIFRTLNQAVPQTSFAGPGQWPDLDMLEVGNGVFSIPEEQTHFSLWAILKSPLTIGAALNDDATSINADSLAILKQKDVISYNQDVLGVSATLRRRWTEEGYEVWSGPLSGDRTVAALINWRNETRDLTLHLPDIGLQHASTVKNIWAGSTAQNIRTAYTARVAGHGTILLELQDTTPSNYYPSTIFTKSTGNATMFQSIYGQTTSPNYNLTITLSKPPTTPTTITIHTHPTNQTTTVHIPPNTNEITTHLSLQAQPSNILTFISSTPISSLTITPPNGTYHPSTDFTVTGTADHTACKEGCLPVGSKITNILPNSTAYATIHSSRGAKYLEIDYVNNDVAFDSAWGWGSNSRNLTVSVNGETPVRVEVPLSGQHSELFGPGLGWWDTASFGVVVDGWKDGDNEIVVGNVGGEYGFQAFGADFVGVRVFE